MPVTVQKVLTKIFGSRNERLLKRLHYIVDEINSLEPKISAMTDEQLRQRTGELRAGIRGGDLRSSDVLPEAFAIIRESMDRHIGIRSIFDPENHFDPEQLDDEHLELYDEVQRRMIASGESWQTISIPPKMYDAVRKLYPESRPPFRARCFDVQIIGGIVLYEGKIAEMATGEGKTFVAPLACFMRCLEAYHCHVVTVNDYLVRRDALWVKPAFDNLGLTVGFIQSEMEPGGDTRRQQYECDITYGTNSEFGFDYLRDNMKVRVEEQVQGPLDFAIVDEVDSILIDEARTPLIISGPAHDDANKYRAADAVARVVIEKHRPYMEAERAVDAAKRGIKLAEGDEDKAKGDKKVIEAARARREKAVKELDEAEKRKEGITQYLEIERDRKTVHMTHEGIASAQEAAGVGSFYVGNNMEWPHLMEQALRAHLVYERDKDYVVEPQRNPHFSDVVIVDEYTGRKMAGRQWSDGLHQAVEAKEKVKIKEETQTLATITLQNFFRLYKSLAGMTGTAQTEAEEFSKIYKLDVVTIPTNRPCIRADNEDRVYRTEKEKYEAIIDEIKEESDKGRPVLVGTTSVEKSEMLSKALMRKYGVEHEVLNAKQHEREATIVAVAGQQHKNAHGEMVGNVTVATNMAGRGTDIKLTPETTQAGGLHVIGTERHTARRIDNQLRGRGGRQGDPGSSRFYVSLTDELMAMFAGEWTIKVLGWLGMEEGMAIEDKRISKGILRAQKKVEERNFMARKNLLEYDDVMDRQRLTFYGMRQKVLEGRDVNEVIWKMIGESIRDAVDKYIEKDYIAAVVADWAKTNFEVQIEPYDLRGMRHFEELEKFIKDQARAEATTNITATLGEFMGEESEDPANWDAKNMASWMMSRFQVNLSQAQIRRTSVDELESTLRDAAVQQINARECSGLQKYLEPKFAEGELAAWAQDKFGIDITADDMFTSGDRARAQKDPADITDMIEQRARAAYARREIEYPVDYAITFAAGGVEGGDLDNPYAAEHLRQWILGKYRAEMSIEQIRGMSVRKLRDELIKRQEQYLTGGDKLAPEVDALIASAGGEEKLEALVKAFNERYALKLSVNDLEPSSLNELAIEEAKINEEYDPSHPPTLSVREFLLRKARQFYRRELTDLEQYVLIQIFDGAWKDHLYAMDILKAGIGLHSFAERDPRILYKKEGFSFFQQMMAGIRDKVTDLIFRFRIQGPVQARSTYRETAAVHEDAGGYGVGENVKATAGAVAGQPEGAAEEGGVATKVKTIVNEGPKVGRNDPCPCGSGKKYKKCHGAHLT
jgi:preprotein translocase subunit SecA